ncbi:hypothetical protein JTB14_007369 [Gonioctena quinquepunctata]|nr:hypothetical protein JTB14_007369 [Gonioctena quinquepunctata]
MEKAKLENQLGHLQLERDLQEEEIRTEEEDRRSQKLGSEDVQSSMSRVQEWLNNSGANISIRNRSNIQPSTTKTQIVEDWKFVSMVLDRFFLWVFTIACVGGTCGIIFQAPSLYDTRVPVDQQLSAIPLNKIFQLPPSHVPII